MTNVKMSLRVSVAVVLALAFCCLVIGQAVTAGEKQIATNTAPQLKTYMPTPPPVKDIVQPEGLKVRHTTDARQPDKPAFEGRVPHVDNWDTKEGGEDCTNAVVISTLPFDDTGDTGDNNDDYSYGGGPDVVYAYTPSVNEDIDISLCESSFDTYMSVFEGDCSGTEYAYNDDACGTRSALYDLSVTAGNTYYIVVDGYGSSSYGAYEINVMIHEDCDVECPTGATAEGEGDCYDDYDDVTNGGCNSSPEVFGSISNGETICGTSGAFLYGSSNYRDTDWFLYEPTQPETLKVWSVAEFPLLLGVVDGLCGSAAFVSSTTADECDTASIEVLVQPGSYAIFVAPSVFEGYDCGLEYVLHMDAVLGEEIIGPDNDDCANATPIGEITGLVFSNVGGTLDDPAGYMSGPDVWFCYTATCDGQATASLCTSDEDYDTKMIVWEGCTCYPTTYLDYDDDACASYGPSEVSWTATAGGQYLIQVGTWGDEYPDMVLDVSCSVISLPPNDDCVNAIAIGDVVDLAFHNIGATTDGPDEPDNCLFYSYSQIGSDIWYCYTATCDGVATASLCGSGYDTKIGIYAGCSCPVTPAEFVACNEDACDLQSEVSWEVLIGEQYLIRIGGYGDAQGTGILNTSCFAPPYNDNCEDAVVFALSEDTTVVSGNIQGSTNDCEYYYDDPQVWETFTLDTCYNVYIDYCLTPEGGPGWSFYPYLHDACPCELGNMIEYSGYDFYGCPGGVTNAMFWVNNVKPGQYWFPVASQYAGPYTLQIYGFVVECTHCEAGANYEDEYIAEVEVGTIDNVTGWDGYGNYYDTHVTDMYQYIGYDFLVTGEGTYSSDYVSIWIDWDNDLEFDGPNEFFDANGSPGYGPYDGTITPPTEATETKHRMRVRMTYGSSYHDACGYSSWGDVEDYGINVLYWTCGDCDGDGDVDDLDIVCLKDFYFTLGAAPAPLVAGDANGDGYVNIADIVYVADYLYRSGPAPICIF